MKKLARLTAVEPVIQGVLRLSFVDGYDGVVDLRPLLAKGKVFEWLQDPEHFRSVRLDEYGHSISWQDESGYSIDLSADGLRRDCERQAEIHKLMAS